MALSPDLLYEKRPEFMASYEDARFATLIQGAPDCYPSLSDSTLLGSVMRVIAMEIARLNFDYDYDLASLEPQYLTPPDIRRQYAAPLNISKSYPEASQFDIDYRNMLTGLIQAYPEGTTTDAIQNVILAYTGETVPVEELYLQIGNGVYTSSDRNTIKVRLSTQRSGGLSAIAGASLIETLAENLYSAIDLAKPAHVGLIYALTFGSIENLSFLIALMTDKLSITYYGEEAAPLPPILTFAPMENPASPDTRLTGWGLRAGSYLSATITPTQYGALLSDDFRAEYLINPNGSYTLDPARIDDVLLTDANGNPTGVVSRAQGVLAPQLNTAWEMKSDTLKIYRL